MPCSDPVGYEAYHNSEECKKLQNQITHLEACLCAVLTELEKSPELFEKIKVDSQKNGGINIREYWRNHKLKDLERLQRKLVDFSQHERLVMLHLLEKEFPKSEAKINELQVDVLNKPSELK